MLRTTAIVAASFIAGPSGRPSAACPARHPHAQSPVIDIKDNDGYKNAVGRTCASASAKWAGSISSLLASQDRASS